MDQDGSSVWKHSSGDLHSRLKTRKILGVGETDNGDIHRSKISQVLGHNEHLYVKLPRGFWSAHVVMGVTVTIEAALLLLTPSWAATVGVMPPFDDDDATSASRMAGAALAGLCVFVWSILGTSDKHYARTMLLSMLTYHVLAVCVTGAAAMTGDNAEGIKGNRLAAITGARATMCLLCLAYFYSIAGYTPIRGQRPMGYQQHCHINKEH
ncbi:tumor protein p53-inducible protein 11-like isoform X2 [Palaemon carinicauda]|uniref:tumor protein p53-inducible protein 11-like isoform X2 n=1 Tax=Palaemon carinicauda TaxID=392227 RepID=UPI0035B63625